MFRSSRRVPSRAFIALTLSGATLTAAGAATYHRFAVSQGTGSAGATTYLQSGTGSALQGEVAPSANTSITTPFGVLGEFNPPGSSFGVGMLGISTTGYAVAGESLSNTQPSILAYPGGNGIGLEATTLSTSSNPAILGASQGTGAGVAGTTNVAVTGSSASFGVSGEDLSSPPPNGDSNNVGVFGVTYNGQAGILGSAQSHFTTGNGAGVVGDTPYGAGVYGISTGTAGVEASNGGAGDGVDASASTGFALNGSTGNNSAASLTNESSSIVTLSVANDGTGDVIEALGAEGGLLLNADGDLSISGSFAQHSGDSFQRTDNPASDVMSYGEQSTEPTIEDVGSARLVNGTAAVSLAGDFRQTIDGSNYMVFLTPYGENDGLYIASRTQSGFVVRESHSGRSTLSFDYRIVAQKYGTHAGRLPHFSTLHPEMTNQRLAEIRSNSLKRYEASRTKLAAEIRQDGLMRTAFQHRLIAQPLPANPLGAHFSKR